MSVDTVAYATPGQASHVPVKATVVVPPRVIASAQQKSRAAERSAAAQRASRSQARAPLSARAAQDLGRSLAARRGWSGSQWRCLVTLWTRESDWRVTAKNASSGAYGIPQALPARKMATAGGDYRTSAATQIRWGLGYIAASYGTPCGALSDWDAKGWY